MATVYETSVLAFNSYQPRSSDQLPPIADPKRLGWELVNTPKKAESGVEAAAYRNKLTGEIVVSYRGTDDLRGDVVGGYPAVIAGEMPTAQFQQAVEFLNEVWKSYPDASVVLTGHSLGGILAQAVSVVVRSLTGLALPTTTFAAPGARSAIEKWLYKPIDGLTSQITNYVHPSDLVGTFRDHAGEVRYWGGIQGPGVGELPLGVQILASPVLVLAAAPSIFLTHRIPNAVEWFRDDPEGQRVVPGSFPPVQGTVGNDTLNSTDERNARLNLSVFTDDQRSVLEQLQDEGVLKLAPAVDSTSSSSSSGDSSDVGTSSSSSTAGENGSSMAVDQLGSQATLNDGEGALIPEDATPVLSGVRSALSITSIASSDLPDDQKALRSASAAASFASQAVGPTSTLGEWRGVAGVALVADAVQLAC